MRKHVDLVGVLYLLWGGMTLLISVSLLSIGFAATAIGASSTGAPSGGKLAAGLVAAVFFVLSGAGFLFGVVHLWIGSKLRGYRDWARAMAILLAIIDLVMLPFGTALGVYALWTLLNASSRTLFELGTPAAAAARR